MAWTAPGRSSPPCRVGATCPTCWTAPWLPYPGCTGPWWACRHGLPSARRPAPGRCQRLQRALGSVLGGGVGSGHLRLRLSLMRRGLPVLLFLLAPRFFLCGVGVEEI